MDIQKILNIMRDCPCGKEHNLGHLVVEIEPGVLERTAEILKVNGFPRKLLAVADKNTMNAATGLPEILAKGGFQCEWKIFDNMRKADMTEVDALIRFCKNVDGVLSVGSGSLNDICRLASFKINKEFAIFATAPSMDGFAANHAPITEHSFKKSFSCHAPSIIIGDTEILAKAPAELKSAGFGDMVAKYVAIVDWKIAHLLIGEYYCPRVAELILDALQRVISLADKVTKNDQETAGSIMEALVMSGIAMSLTGCSRPASGSEHMISHFWEIKKLEQHELPDFHGKQVGVATLMVAQLYHEIVNRTIVLFHDDSTDWDAVYAVYGPSFTNDIQECNIPAITEEISPTMLRKQWSQIRKMIQSDLPSPASLLSLMQTAGAATSIKEINITQELAEMGMLFHPYLRRRMTLTRLLPMVGN